MTSKKLSTKKKVYKNSLSESQIQDRLIKKLRRTNVKVFIVKLSDKWVSGLPDVMMVLNGQAYFYEVKSVKGVVSKIQEVVHRELREAGALVEVVRGVI